MMAEGRIDARRLSETRRGEGGRSFGVAYLYKDKDVRHGSIEITVHRRCIPMWKARWTLNSHWPSEREEAEATEFTVPRGCIVRIILSSPRTKHTLSILSSWS